jgi:hypothetical protein
MCEPCHSIIQYSDFDDDERSSGVPTEQRLSNNLGTWLRKIGRWLHLSKMGSGHSEAIQKTSLQNELFLPTPTFYEVNWWERKMHIDGVFRSSFSRLWQNTSNERYALIDALREESKEAAQQYANAVSIGNLTTLRRFLKSSIQKSTMPIKYLLHFELMLNSQGRDLLNRKARSFGFYRKTGHNVGNAEVSVEQMIKLLMGFTRKRELLRPEWADDGRLWVPDKSIGS